MTTGEEIMRALETHRVIEGMIQDPDLTGDLLLIAIAFQTVVLPGVRGRTFTRTRTWLDAVSEAAGLRPFSIQMRIGDDTPRYQPPIPGYDFACDAPMIRRHGTCGQPATTKGLDINPATGEQWMIGRCSRHNARAIWLARDERRRAWVDNGQPRPPHNTGGILRRHFPDIDWARLYTWAAPHLEQTPGEGKPPTPRPPKLTLIRGGAE